MIELNESFVHLAADRPVASAKINLTRRVPAHGHLFHEISLITAGSAVHLANDFEHPVEAGCLVFAIAGAMHGYEAVDGLTKHNLYFSTDWLIPDQWPEAFPQVGADNSIVAPLESIVVELRGDAFQTVKSELDAIEGELRLKRPSDTFLKACTLKILVEIGRANVATTQRPVQGANFETWATLRRIEALAASGSRLDRNKLALAAGVHPETLNRLVRAETGLSLTRVYQKMRVRQACRMLLNPSNINVTEVAHRLGYADTAHLHRHFTREMHCTPSEFRRNSLRSDPGELAL